MRSPAVNSIRSLFLWSLMIKITFCLLMALLLLVYWYQVVSVQEMRPRYWILGFLLVPGVVVSFLVRRQVLRDELHRWAIWLFGVESAFTWLVSYWYFQGPMHDMALDYLGHHGRFGVAGLEGGASPYLVDDFVLSLILFMPSFFLGSVYFVQRRIAGRPEALSRDKGCV